MLFAMKKKIMEEKWNCTKEKKLWMLLTCDNVSLGFT